MSCSSRHPAVQDAHSHRDVHTFSMNCNSKDIDHLGSTATAEPPLCSALAETSPAHVVEKQRACQLLPQELRCGIRVFCTVCTVRARLSCRKDNGQTTALSKNGTCRKDNGHVKTLSRTDCLDQKPLVCTTTGTSTSCRLVEINPLISADLRIRVLLLVEATAAARRWGKSRIRRSQPTTSTPAGEPGSKRPPTSAHDTQRTQHRETPPRTPPPPLHETLWSPVPNDAQASARDECVAYVHDAHHHQELECRRCAP